MEKRTEHVRQWEKYIDTNPLCFDAELCAFVLDGQTQISGITAPLQRVVERFTCIVRTREDAGSAELVCRHQAWHSGCWDWDAARMTWTDLACESDRGRVAVSEHGAVALRGRQHGSLVHRQLQAWVNVFCDARRGLRSPTPADAEPGDDAESAPEDGEACERSPPLWEIGGQSPRDVFLARVHYRPDPCVRTLTTFLRAQHWIPLGAEVCTWTEGRIGTAADLVVYDARTREIIVIELKTGHERPMRIATWVRGLQRRAHAKILKLPCAPDSPRAPRALPVCKHTEHQLQLLATCTLLRARGLRVNYACLVYIEHRTQRLHVYQQPARFVREYSKVLWYCLVHRATVLRTGAIPRALDGVHVPAPARPVRRGALPPNPRRRRGALRGAPSPKALRRRRWAMRRTRLRNRALQRRREAGDAVCESA